MISQMQKEIDELTASNNEIRYKIRSNQYSSQYVSSFRIGVPDQKVQIIYKISYPILIDFISERLLKIGSK